jgi:tRNA-(ms[2]io[6]A)-hydroxylase
LLVASVIETRGAERFRMIAEALEDPALKDFYRDLWATEARHGDVFKKMALKYFNEDEIESRNQEIIDAEAKIIANLEWRPSLH